MNKLFLLALLGFALIALTGTTIFFIKKNVTQDFKVVHLISL